MSSKRNTQYYGRAIGYTLVIAYDEINVTKTFDENYQMALELEEELRNTQEYKFLYEDLINKSDEHWVPFFMGLKKGITAGLKHQGIQSDNSHMSKQQNAKIIKKMYGYMRDFIIDRQKKDHNKKISMDFDSEKNIVLINNFTLITKLHKLKAYEFMISTGTDLSKYIATNQMLLGTLRQIIHNCPYSQFLDSYMFEFVGTTPVPDSMLRTFKDAQHLPPPENRQTVEPKAKVEKLTNIDSIKKDIFNKKDQEFMNELDEHIEDFE